MVMAPNGEPHSSIALTFVDRDYTHLKAVKIVLLWSLFILLAPKDCR